LAVRVDAFAFPKLSFQREGFFVGALGGALGVAEVGAGAGTGGGRVVFDAALRARGLSMRFGIA